MTPTPNPPALLPCPWCNSTDLLAGFQFGHPGVECKQCGAIGPRGETDDEEDATSAWNTRQAPAEPKVSREAPWHETDAHRDLSRIIPDMEAKIAKAERLYSHCLPKGMFGPLQASITELRVLRHELSNPPADGDGWREAVRSIMARCEALEEEAYNGLATVIANNGGSTHEAGHWRAQKYTAKGIRRELHDLTRHLAPPSAPLGAAGQIGEQPC